MPENPKEPWKREINESEFFYVEEDNYDDHVELSIPFYREMHLELARILRARPNSRPWRVLDLGSGTGKTSYVILNQFAVERLDAVDLFEVMHGHARSRLKGFSSRVRFITGDFMDAPFDGPYDVCVSSLAIHHQNKAGKIAVFRRIRESLNSDGVFVLIDWTNFHSALNNRLAYESACDNVRSRATADNIADKWAEHWRTNNIPSTVEDQCEWLRKVGFSAVECPLRYWGMAMICAWVSEVSVQ